MTDINLSIHKSSWYGCLGDVRTFVTEGLANSVDSNDRTALFYAAYIEKEADFKNRKAYQDTRDKKWEIMQLLFENGVDLDHLDHERQPALYYALRGHSLLLLRAILKQRPKTDTITEEILSQCPQTNVLTYRAYVFSITCDNTDAARLASEIWREGPSYLNEEDQMLLYTSTDPDIKALAKMTTELSEQARVERRNLFINNRSNEGSSSHMGFGRGRGGLRRISVRSIIDTKNALDNLGSEHNE